MSRFDSDLDFWEAINGPDQLPATASCQDCGTDIVPSSNPCCDACSDQREAWAAALETRLAKLPAVAHVVDVADRCVCGVRLAGHRDRRGRVLSCVVARRRSGTA